MGSTKQTSGGEQKQTMVYTPTAEETELNKLALEREKFLDPFLRSTQSSGLSLASKLLQGNALPGYLNTLPGGISPQVTQSMVDQSLRDLNANLAGSGVGSFMESGVAQQAGVRASADIRNQAEQFNINNLLQLLNLGVGSQAQAQQGPVGYSQLLSSRLAGLRTQTSTGTSSGFGKTKYDFFTSPFVLGAQQAAGNAAAGMCWVAAEVFGGWEKLATRYARLYLVFNAPEWFLNLYRKHGEAFARFISDKPFIKNVVREAFVSFARKGGYTLAR